MFYRQKDKGKITWWKFVWLERTSTRWRYTPSCQDTVANTLKNEWASYSDLLRKAFHFEEASLERKESWITTWFESQESRPIACWMWRMAICWYRRRFYCWICYNFSRFYDKICRSITGGELTEKDFPVNSLLGLNFFCPLHSHNLNICSIHNAKIRKPFWRTK